MQKLNKHYDGILTELKLELFYVCPKCGKICHIEISNNTISPIKNICFNCNNEAMFYKVNSHIEDREVLLKSIKRLTDELNEKFYSGGAIRIRKRNRENEIYNFERLNVLIPHLILCSDSIILPIELYKDNKIIYFPYIELEIGHIIDYTIEDNKKFTIDIDNHDTIVDIIFNF